MSDARPIGIFDSGLGGLTVVSRIEKHLPAESIVYFGDTARVPYGNKSKETVTKFAVENIEFLMKHNVKFIIVACNTASALSLDFLKRCFRVPIIGVIEAGAKRAAVSTKNNRIGLIGTQATVSSGAYEKALKALSSKFKFFSHSCPLFVPLVEEGWQARSVTRAIASIYLAPLKRKKIDTLILGCTHYPLLKDAIRKVMGAGVLLVDSAEEVAAEAKGVLDANGLLNGSRARPERVFFASDHPERFAAMTERFLNRRITCLRKTA